MVHAHAASQLKRVEHGLWGGLVFSDDVVGSAVGRGRDRYGQAAMHGDAFFKAQ